MIPTIIKNDPYLKPYSKAIISRINKVKEIEQKLTEGKTLSEFSNAHKYFGMHKTKTGWIYRDWLPNATEVFLIGDFSDWQNYDEFKLNKKVNGIFEITLPLEALNHQDLYKIHVKWNGGEAERIPAYAKKLVQDKKTNIFSAQIWNPEKPYKQKYSTPKNTEEPLIYEAHIGMSSENEEVASFNYFRENIIPRIKKAGYNTIQLMAIQEHPYYGSFGYHVSSFFAVSERFGTPDELKMLIDEAHKQGLKIIMDIVHSHAVKNELEGLSKYDGTDYQYFHAGGRGMHPAWDSKCFDYGKNEVMHFLLSNCKYWIEEYDFDGFRFDGVTSMLYLNHGLGTDFVSYEQYYNHEQDEDAITYLTLANKLIHEIKPNAISIAEEMSGMPGTACPVKNGGLGFDYRLAMGIPDFWIKLIKEVKDENWHVGDIFYRLTDKRKYEKVVSYAESHDQALVGDKTIIFRLADSNLYYSAAIYNKNFETERALSLHKIIRFITAVTAGGAYLNFMGNEFGHPEWIDFPREGNSWSYKYARRQWSLSDNKDLIYYFLKMFDKDMISFIKKYNILKDDKVYHIHQNDYDQVLVFKRSNLYFIVNFNPISSFFEYGFRAEKGNYKIVFNSDNSKYLGYDRVDETMIYKTTEDIETGKHYLKVYAANRAILVYEKISD